jgi:hypothetical protein
LISFSRAWEYGEFWVKKGPRYKGLVMEKIRTIFAVD